MVNVTYGTESSDLFKKYASGMFLVVGHCQGTYVSNVLDFHSEVCQAFRAAAFPGRKTTRRGLMWIPVIRHRTNHFHPGRHLRVLPNFSLSRTPSDMQNVIRIMAHMVF